MSDPLELMSEAAAAGDQVVDAAGELGTEAGPPPRWLELFQPCKESSADYADHAGARTIDGGLERAFGVNGSDAGVGGSVLHCASHLFPGGADGLGLPPLAGLAWSLFKYGDQVRAKKGAAAS